jgi:hypothetical protein
MPKRSDIQAVVSEFVESLSSLIEQETVSRAREAVLNAFGSRAPVGQLLRGAGRVKTAVETVEVRRKRRKGPIQLCPVPGCSNRAAPVFGMVCAKHQDLPKAEIAKYRELRRSQKHKEKKTPKVAGTAAKAAPKKIATKTAPKSAPKKAA